MRYVQPFDQPSNPTAPYVDLNEAMGVDGSVPPAKFFNDLQAEILSVITGAGFTPTDGDLQLLDAILALMPSPSGGPSDASLVHFGIDDGTANDVVLTISPPAAGVSQGFMVFFRPAATNTGASQITINLTPSGSNQKNLRRADGSALRPGDLLAGQLAAAVCTSGTEFRLAWVHNRGIVTDGVTVFGTGADETDPVYALRSGFGVEIGQHVEVGVYIAGSFSGPTAAGFAIGQIYPASAIKTGAWGSTINGNLIGTFPVNASVNTGVAASWPAPACSVEGEVIGNWRLVGWAITSGVTGITYYVMKFRRVN